MNLNHKMDVKKASRYSAFNRENLKNYGTGAVVSAVVFSSNANALDVAGATSGSTAQTDIETGAVWMLGIAVVIFAAKKVIGFFSR